MSDEIKCIVGYTGFQDIQLLYQALEGTGIQIVTIVSDGVMLADQARSMGLDCALFTPTLPGMTPSLVQELLTFEDHPIAAVGLIPAGSGYASEYSRFGMKGFIMTPLDVVQLQRLPELIRSAVSTSRAERNARTFTPVTADDALAILDRGGWQQQTIAVYSPKGGAGKTTISTNLACALGMIAQRPTLLIDADMSRANTHVLLKMEIPDEPMKHMVALYETVVSQGKRSGNYVVRAQMLQNATRLYGGKLSFLPGIPQMHQAGSDLFMEDPQRTMTIFADLLREARGFFDFRIIDTGPDYNTLFHWSALANADLVLLVVTPERTTLNDIQGIIPNLAATFNTLQRFRIVLNGYDERWGMSPKDIAEFMGGRIPIVATLPWSPEEARGSINQQKPLVLQKPLNPLGEGIVKLAAQFYPPLEALLRKKEVKREGVLKSVFGTFAKGGSR